MLLEGSFLQASHMGSLFRNESPDDALVGANIRDDFISFLGMNKFEQFLEGAIGSYKIGAMITPHQCGFA